MAIVEKRADKQPGGFARAKILSPERRSEIARDAVNKRWAGHVKKAGVIPALVVAEPLTGNIDGRGDPLSN